MTITVTYRSIDGFAKRRAFKTIKGARAFAVHYVGEHPDMGSGYAVSFDGVGRITVDGTSLAALFGIEPPQQGEFEVIGRVWCEDEPITHTTTLAVVATYEEALQEMGHMYETGELGYDSYDIAGRTPEARAIIYAERKRAYELAAASYEDEPLPF